MNPVNLAEENFIYLSISITCSTYIVSVSLFKNYFSRHSHIKLVKVRLQSTILLLWRI